MSNLTFNPLIRYTFYLLWYMYTYIRIIYIYRYLKLLVLLIWLRDYVKGYCEFPKIVILMFVRCTWNFVFYNARLIIFIFKENAAFALQYIDWMPLSINHVKWLLEVKYYSIQRHLYFRFYSEGNIILRSKGIWW